MTMDSMLRVTKEALKLMSEDKIERPGLKEMGSLYVSATEHAIGLGSEEFTRIYGTDYAAAVQKILVTTYYVGLLDGKKEAAMRNMLVAMRDMDIKNMDAKEDNNGSDG